MLEASIYHRWGTWLHSGRYYTPVSAEYANIDVYHTRIFQPLKLFAWSGKNIARPPGPNGEVMMGNEAPARIKEFLRNGGEPAWNIYYQNVSGHEIPRAYVTPYVSLVDNDALAAVSNMDPYATSIIDIQDPVNRAYSDDDRLRRIDYSESTPADNPRAVFKRLNEDIEVTTYTCNRAAFTVNTDSGGFFNYSDGYYPGWKAYVDGQPVALYRTNHLFKGVLVPAGKHRIDFVYDPPSFRLGLVISCVSVCIIVGIACACVPVNRLKRMMVGIPLTGLCIVLAVLAYQQIYKMAHREGRINYDPDAPRPIAGNLDQYLTDYKGYVANYDPVFSK